MKHTGLKVVVIAFAIAAVVYGIVFTVLQRDKQKRIDAILQEHISQLDVHYKLSEKYFHSLADLSVMILQKDPVVISLLLKIENSKSAIKANNYRTILYKYLIPYYEKLKKFGVLQVHFVDTKNVTLLRLHKPSKYGDDLSDFKYSFTQVNKTHQPIWGLEKGRTYPSYRDVYPLKDKYGHYIAAVDVAFSPEVIQQNLLQTSGIKSHFLVLRSIMLQRGWKRNDKEETGRSCENSAYVMFYSDETNPKGSCSAEIKRFLKKKHTLIAKKMAQHKRFALYFLDEKSAQVIAFLPLKNIKGEYIAYLVSYVPSSTLWNIVEDFYLLNVVLVILLLLFVYVIYKTYMHSHDLKKEKNRYEVLASYDPLTKLPNRTLLFLKLEEIRARSKREKRKFALLFLDLDNFKSINDTHGHNEGDKVLKYVSKTLRKLLRKEDTLARFGGDEFVIVLEEAKTPRDISVVAQKIIEKLKEPLDFGYAKYYIGASIGISVYPDDAEDIHELIRFADTAMYTAKKAGRNRYAFFSKELEQNVVEKITVENEMRYGIENDQFVIYYQPQIDARDGKLVGFEALVRWHHPKKGVIHPYEFIPIAEESQLIVELDRYLMRKSMEDLARWKKLGYRFDRISINLSIKELQKEDFINDLTFALYQEGCDASWVELEITEGLIMKDTKNALTKLRQLAKLGVKISIDDFGTGYSSLAYLKKLPINKLKIDKSFVDDMLEDNDSKVIVKTIIDLAKNLHLEVLAEGVENEEQKEFLVQNGCYIIQGFYYSKPLPAKEIEKKYFTA